AATAILILPAALLIYLAHFAGQDWLKNPLWWLIPAAGWLALALWWMVVTVPVSVTITTTRTIEQRGFISRHTSEVLHKHVRNIRVKQGILDRIFNVGMVTLDSSAGGGEDEEIEVRDLPSPNRIRRLVDEHRSV
ncbi:MAG: PH domain-containing protein, partial [Planctomycetota bacterium]|nr:PH domain-containing protein [Planctomycetota bacterium]